MAVCGDAGVVFEDSGFLKAESPLWICSPGIWCGACGGAEVLSRDIYRPGKVHYNTGEMDQERQERGFE